MQSSPIDPNRYQRQTSTKDTMVFVIKLQKFCLLGIGKPDINETP
jgi:hypothetical protein